MISERDWIWNGHPAHLIVGPSCQFHLATRIGDYIISTVGEYRPVRPVDPTSRIGIKRGDIDENVYGEFDTVGAGRLFETFVFNAGGSGFGELIEYLEIDSLPANDHDTATRNHMELCRKYAGMESDA